MKELQTAKPLVLGLIGLPAAGKTRFASEFSTMFGAPVIEADLLSRSIFGKAPSKTYEEGVKKAYWALAEELSKSKRTFLLDGYLHSFAGRSEARALAKKAGYDVLWLWVQTSEAVAQTRATKPKRGATNTPLTADAFTKAVRSFEAPRPSEDHVVISGQRTFSSQVRPILKKIAEGHESQLQSPRPIIRPTDTPTDRPAKRNIFIR